MILWLEMRTPLICRCRGLEGGRERERNTPLVAGGRSVRGKG